jgi:hypothetical protein
MALITLLNIDQTDKVPTPMERPRQVSDVIANVTPMGHAPLLPCLLSTIKEDTTDGTRLLLGLTPQLGTTAVLIEWNSSRNIFKLLPDKNLAFCPRAVIDGVPQSFVVGPGPGNSPLR